MNEVRFVQEREPAWRDLAALVAKARGGAVSRLTGEELRRLAAGNSWASIWTRRFGPRARPSL
jgi:hypothetical protein